ncbi:MAG: DNA replication protein DnaC, partial [Clostridia bacterium]|nr:DNA replication protein DnaC [Clostridia bacterium]
KAEKLKYEKACILQEENLPINYLKPTYECSFCQDTGYILGDNYKTNMCNCLKQRLLDTSFHKSNMTNLNKENFDNFNENLFSDEIDVAKYHFNLSPRNNIKNIKQKCLDFVQNFDNSDYKNLLFTGNTGLR